MANIANVIIALFSMFIAGYVIIYQKSKDRTNIRLQWFKDLIILPHIGQVYKFYEDVTSSVRLLQSEEVNEDFKQSISEELKHTLVIFRKNFIELLRGVNSSLHVNSRDNVDNLIDEITNYIFLDSVNFNDKKESEIVMSRITHSKVNFISLIFKYKGN